MKFFLPTLLIGLFSVSSCHKRQRTVNRLEGKWNVIEATLSGSGEQDPDLIFEFERCEVNQHDFCEFGVYDFAMDAVQNGLYSVENNDSLALMWSDGFTYECQTFRLERLNWRTLILTDSDAPNGQYSRIQLRFVK